MIASGFLSGVHSVVVGANFQIKIAACLRKYYVLVHYTFTEPCFETQGSDATLSRSSGTFLNNTVLMGRVDVFCLSPII